MRRENTVDISRPSIVQNQGSKQLPFKGELLRKLTHVFAIVIPGGYYILQLTKVQALSLMIPIALCMIIIDIGRLRDWRIWHILRRLISPVIRESEMRGDFTGATYILTTACLAVALFSKPIAVTSLAFIIAGDPASALIGTRYGKHRFRNKSLEGSTAFLAAAVLVALCAPELPLAVGLVGAVVATFTEAVSFVVDDNATVPLVSGLVMTLMMNILIGN